MSGYQSTKTTYATTAPTWLFIKVTPHLFEAVLSALNALSVVAYVVAVDL